MVADGASEPEAHHSLEAQLVASVQESLALYLYDNARFLCERLVAESPTEVLYLLHSAQRAPLPPGLPRGRGRVPTLGVDPHAIELRAQWEATFLNLWATRGAISCAFYPSGLFTCCWLCCVCQHQLVKSGFEYQSSISFHYISAF
jgi:hypothetical protein